MTIKVVCECGKSFLAKEELAGRRVKCPNCGGSFTVPVPNAGGLLDFDELFDEEAAEPATASAAPRPKKRKKASKAPLIAGVAVGVVLLAGLAVTATVMVARSGMFAGVQQVAEMGIPSAGSALDFMPLAWHTWEAPEDQVRAKFPAKPSVAMSHMTQALCQSDDQSYAVQIIHFDAAMPPARTMLNKVIEIRHRGSVSSMFQASEIALRGYPGREIISHNYTNGELFQLHERTFVVGKDNIRIFWTGPADQKPGNVESFLDGLEYRGAAGIVSPQEPLGDLARQFNRWDPSQVVVPTHTIPQVDRSAYDYSEWHTLESAKFGVRVKLPQEASSKSEHEMLTWGLARPNESFSFRVIPTQEKYTDDEIIEMGSQIPGSLRLERISHRGYPGLDVVNAVEPGITDKKIIRRTRMFSCNNLLVTMAWAALPDAEISVEAEQFLDSFEYLGTDENGTP